MPNLLHEIQSHLNSASLRDNLAPLFRETLNWGRPKGQPRAIAIGSPLGSTLTVSPVAQLSGLPVFRVDWKEEKLPNSTQRKAVHRTLASTNLEHLLCYVTPDQRQASFVWARKRKDNKTELRTLPFEVNSQARTTIERLGELAFSFEELGSTGEPAITAVTDKLNNAFNVEAVNEDFYRHYESCFYDEVKPTVLKILSNDADAHSFTQLLLNRLMFCWFLQKKGWLGKNDKSNYLLQLLARANRPRAQREGGDSLRSFYHDYLTFLFFRVLSNPEEERHKYQPSDPNISWEAPFLNGGLFERTALDDRIDIAPRLKRLPNSLFKTILDDLFARYNFTVEESTALDLQVALDPELLGTIFERLVTGRHESGSYYTPRPVVEFMCREALVHYLVDSIRGSNRTAIEELVYEHSVEKLSPTNSTEIIRALDAVRICDPACGSGAYLVNALHELVALYRAIYSDKLKKPMGDHELKLRIIERNLYGVDSDPFAVNIARLRLWLSLVVDDQSNDWREIEPLPNLDFKIEVGDSLTAPAPDAQQGHLRKELITNFQRKKSAFLKAHGQKKQELRVEIEKLREDIASWTHPSRYVHGFDWVVDFAEVFLPEEQIEVTWDGRLGITNDLGGQQTFTEHISGKSAGFNIILANPPYIRYQLIDPNYKSAFLKKNFPEVYESTDDLYVFFYARAHQLLRQGGVCCFISSNKWLRAGYGEKLRQHLLDSQSFHLVADFGELPVFHAAATFPAIFLWQKNSRDKRATIWAVIKDLNACYEDGIRDHINRISQTIPASHFGKGKPRLTSSAGADQRTKMESSGQRLGDYVNGLIFNGIKTGINEAFIIDASIREKLVEEDPLNAEIIKPLLMGDNIRRYETHFRDLYLIRTEIGINIKRYPTILRYLKKWKAQAEIRDARGQEWWELRPCNYYEYFEQPKIVYPDIGKECRFTLDETGYHTDYTVFNIPFRDYFLLGVLNSTSVWNYLKMICSALGDENKGGRLRFYRQYMETLPIPTAITAEKQRIGNLVLEVHKLHTKRRCITEKFLRRIGIPPARSNSRNVIEQPWSLTHSEITHRVRGMTPAMLRSFNEAHDETVALTEEITKIEREIDERVAALYGL